MFTVSREDCKKLRFSLAVRHLVWQGLVTEAVGG